jgi:two-component system, cell cycle response regulator
MSAQSGDASKGSFKANILVIDDQESVRKKIKSILHKADLIEFYFEAKSGLDGIKMLMDKKVDLVICDVVMPEFDGYKFLISKSTKPEFDEIPVIMLTSEEDVEKKIKGFEHGATDYLTKPFDEGELIARVKAHLKIKHLQDELKEKNALLQELSGTDDLTKLANRRRFMEQFASEFARAKRYKTELSFLILDLDFFKQVNDSHGHLAGDSVLVQIAKVMKESVRSSDLVGRYGGEEFGLLLPETGLKGSRVYADRIRKRIEDTRFEAAGKLIHVTVSGGISSYPEISVETVDELWRKADQALYRAKQNGRNRIELAH